MIDLVGNFLGFQHKLEFSTSKQIEEVRREIGHFISSESEIEGEMKGNHFHLQYKWHFLVQFRSWVSLQGVVWPQKGGSIILVNIQNEALLLGLLVPFCLFASIGLVGFVFNLFDNQLYDALNFLFLIFFATLFLIPIFIMRYVVNSLVRFIEVFFERMNS